LFTSRLRGNALRLTWVGCLSASLLAGCGGSVTSSGGGEPGFANGDRDGDASANPKGADPRLTGDRAVPTAPPRCPGSKPADGDSCDEEGLGCTYGDSPVWSCRSSAKCLSGSWSIDSPNCGETAVCRAEVKAGEPCEAASMSRASACGHLDSLCACYTCNRFSPEYDSCLLGNGSTWQCWKAPEDLDCPLTPPNLGDGCSSQGKSCTYGDACDPSGLIVLCRLGEWEKSGISCPQ